MGIYSILRLYSNTIYFFALIVSALGAHLTLVSLLHARSLGLFISLLLLTFSLAGNTRYPRLIVYIYFISSRISHLLKDPWLLISENFINFFLETKIRVLGDLSIYICFNSVVHFINWLDLLAVQGTLKSLLQHHSSKESILLCSGFFIVQLSHPYMTIGKTIALTRQAFIGKVMSRLFNMLSRLIIAFLPRSRNLLISWLQSPSAAILEPHKIKSVTVSTVFPSICHKVMGPDAMILIF